jgi:CBS domain containing-hemolysin-like protein
VSLNNIANACVRLLGIQPRQEVRSSFSRDEVAGFVQESHREGLLSEEEEHLLSGGLNLEAQTVKSVILPLEKLVFTSAKPTPAEIEQLSVKTGFSRFPVPDKKDVLHGYVHLKDVLQVPDEMRDEPLRPSYIRPLTKVKTTMSLRDALATMQQSGTHIAQVANSRNVIIGIIMLEDVLEELVGQIRDETQKKLETNPA